jgi:hypothetical protein
MLILVAALAFVSFGQRQTPPSDFAFRLEYGFCNTDVFDTFQDIFVRDMGGMVPAVSIPLVLPRESFIDAYRAIVVADFFNYPSEFHTKPKSTCTSTPHAGGGATVSCSGITGFAPAWHYRLTVRNSGVTHSVSWRDNTSPYTEEASRLRQMLDAIIEMVRAMPQVQRLPLAQVGCA